jgi:hypothetical protein
MSPDATRQDRVGRLVRRAAYCPILLLAAACHDPGQASGAFAIALQPQTGIPPRDRRRLKTVRRQRHAFGFFLAERPLPGPGRARPRTAAPRTCVRGVHPPTLLRQASPPFTARVSWSAGDHLCLPDNHFCLLYGRDVNESSLLSETPSPRANAASVAAGPLRGSMITAGQGSAALRPPALDRLTHLSDRAC